MCRYQVSVSTHPNRTSTKVFDPTLTPAHHPKLRHQKCEVSIAPGLPIAALTREDCSSKLVSTPTSSSIASKPSKPSKSLISSSLCACYRKPTRQSQTHKNLASSYPKNTITITCSIAWAALSLTMGAVVTTPHPVKKCTNRLLQGHIINLENLQVEVFIPPFKDLKMATPFTGQGVRGAFTCDKGGIRHQPCHY